MNWRGTPIYVTNRNNLDRGFRRLITWLQNASMTNLTVIDNNSTYPPLLEYYNELRNIIIRREPRNHGPYAFWELNLHEGQSTRFIVTDPDVVPDKDCPIDLVRKLHEVSDRSAPPPVKIGPAIRIDNLPDHYSEKQRVIDWEKQFWILPRPEGDAYDALIDTTFALYEPKATAWPPKTQYLRLAPPYMVEHMPWYEDSWKPTAEYTFYKNHAEREWTNW